MFFSNKETIFTIHVTAHSFSQSPYYMFLYDILTFFSMKTENLATHEEKHPMHIMLEQFMSLLSINFEKMPYLPPFLSLVTITSQSRPLQAQITLPFAT
jgi:hypothetical protein